MRYASSFNNWKWLSRSYLSKLNTEIEKIEPTAFVVMNSVKDTKVVKFIKKSDLCNSSYKNKKMSKAKIAGNSPQMEELEAGKNYAWCSCGESANKTWCDGKHAGSEFRPKIFKAEEEKVAAICTCKQTKNPPYCDGSHVGL